MVPFLRAKEQRRKNKFAEKMMHSVLQAIKGSYETTKSRCHKSIGSACLEFRRQGGVSNPNPCRLACCPFIDSLVAQIVKNSPASVGDWGSIPGLGRSPGEGNGNPLQYSYLENSTDRGAWQATIHGVTKNQTLQRD